MKTFYQHYIVDWMDSTGNLDDGAYRVYHVVIQKIYENEGPISLNESSLAGICNQHPLAFRKNLKTLLDLRKLRLTSGRLHNNRARTELKRLADLRQTRAQAGVASGKVRRGSRSKTLENKGSERTHVEQQDSYKREEENREDNPEANASGARKRGSRLPEGWKPTPEDRDEAKRILGQRAGSEYRKFTDHWKAQPGQRGVKQDWDATWRNWVRKAAEMGHGKTQNGHRGGSLLDAIDRAIEKVEADLEASEDAVLSIPSRPIQR